MKELFLSFKFLTRLSFFTVIWCHFYDIIRQRHLEPLSNRSSANLSMYDRKDVRVANLNYVSNWSKNFIESVKPMPICTELIVGWICRASWAGSTSYDTDPLLVIAMLAMLWKSSLVISNLIMTTSWQSLGAIHWSIAFALFPQRRHTQNK